MAIDMKNRRRGGGSIDGKYLAVAVVISLAFFASYSYAAASRPAANPAFASQAASGNAQAGALGGAGGGCCGGGAGAGQSGGAGADLSGGGGAGGCCGSGGPQTTVPGSTTVQGNTQKVTIDLTGGSYSPNEITAKAGVPLELDFKGPASSCNGYVQSQDLGFSQDVSNGGTIKVGPLQPGEYTFACSMNMYTAKIVVK